MVWFCEKEYFELGDLWIYQLFFYVIGGTIFPTCRSPFWKIHSQVQRWSIILQNLTTVFHFYLKITLFVYIKNVSIWLVVISKQSICKGYVGSLSGGKKSSFCISWCIFSHIPYICRKSCLFSPPSPGGFLPVSSKFWWPDMKLKLTAPVFVKFTPFGNLDIKTVQISMQICFDSSNCMQYWH